jgi:hypothetical protein
MVNDREHAGVKPENRPNRSIRTTSFRRRRAATRASGFGGKHYYRARISAKPAVAAFPHPSERWKI